MTDNVKTEFLFEMTADLEPPQMVGETPGGIRMIFNVKGGHFEGPRARGRILPGGGDWFVLRSDGTGVLDVRGTGETDDGALIYVRYHGYLKADPEDLMRMQAGEEVDPSRYYFRTAPIFETAAEQYADLNSLVCVGIGRAGQNQVSYKVYAIR